MPSIPSAPRPTEITKATAAFSSRSRELLPERILDQRVGTGTLAGGLNDQIRFRVAGEGPISRRQLLPDTELAAAILNSPAGPKLERQLRMGMVTADQQSDKTVLKGFILPEDTQAVMAGAVLASLDQDTRDARVLQRALEHGGDRARDKVSAIYKDYKDGVARAGAWNDEGWITFLPDVARSMLVASGAYQPHRQQEKRLRSAGTRADYLVGNIPHEVQHSVTGPVGNDYPRLAWLEEGTANVFSRTPVVHSQNARLSGVNRYSYAAHLGHEPTFDTGWSPWKRPERPKEKEAEWQKEVAKRYERSQPVLRALAGLGGANFSSTAGRELANELLQGTPLVNTAGTLADAIIAEHKLQPDVREHLRRRILHAIDNPTGVKDIRKDFGIDDA